MRTVRLDADAWHSRWQRSHQELIATRKENLMLRAALDELNADVEAMLNAASQDGIEAAKSHAIRRLQITVRNQRARIKELTGGRAQST